MKHKWFNGTLIQPISGITQTRIAVCIHCGFLRIKNNNKKTTIYERGGFRSTTTKKCDHQWPDNVKFNIRYALYLDDIRFPAKEFKAIARSFEEAVMFVEHLGIPYKISFDHDLGEDSKTGFDFAKWLVNYCLDGNPLPTNFRYYVHSAKPPGAANINGLLKNFLDFVKLENKVRLRENTLT